MAFNQRGKDVDIIPWTEWQTPFYVQIKYKKTSGLSPYSDGLGNVFNPADLQKATDLGIHYADIKFNSDCN